MRKAGKFIGPISVISMAGFIMLLARFARYKIAAVYLGPSGVGIIGQTWNLILLINGLSLLGMRSAAARYLGEFTRDGRQEEASVVVHTALRFVLFTSIFWAGVLFLFSGPIAAVIFNDASFGILVILAASAAPFLAIIPLLDGLMQSIGDVKRHFFACILREPLCLAIFTPAVIIFGITGAAGAAAAGGAASLGITAAFFKNRFHGTFKRPHTDNFSAETLAKLIKVGFVVFVCGTGATFALLIVRVLIIRRLGMTEHGIFQAAYGLTNACPEFLAGVSALYVTGYLSGLKAGRVSEGVNEFFGLGILVFISAGCLLLLFAGPLLRLIYSAEFIRAETLLPVMVMGTFLKTGGYLLGLAFVPLLKLRAFLFLQAAGHALFALLSFFLLPVFSLQGAAIAYLACYAALFAGMAVFLKRNAGFSFSHKNKALVAGSLLLLTLLGLLK